MCYPRQFQLFLILLVDLVASLNICEAWWAPYTFCVKHDGLILLRRETWSLIFLICEHEGIFLIFRDSWKGKIFLCESILWRGIGGPLVKENWWKETCLSYHTLMGKKLVGHTDKRVNSSRKTCLSVLGLYVLFGGKYITFCIYICFQSVNTHSKFIMNVWSYVISYSTICLYKLKPIELYYW